MADEIADLNLAERRRRQAREFGVCLHKTAESVGTAHSPTIKVLMALEPVSPARTVPRCMRFRSWLLRLAEKHVPMVDDGADHEPKGAQPRP